MPFLTAEQAAAVASGSVRFATLVDMEFATATTRLWNGFGQVVIAGHTYDGVGAFGSVDGLEQSRDTRSGLVTLRLSGVDASLLAKAKNSVAEVQGRNAYVWGQLFDDALAPVGARIPLFWGAMQRLLITRGSGDGDGQTSRVLELEVENAFVARSRVPGQRYTDEVQRDLYPGDKFFRFVTRQRAKVIIWPNY